MAGLGAVNYSFRDLYPDYTGHISTDELTQPEEADQKRYTTPEGERIAARAWHYAGVLVVLVVLAIFFGWGEK